MRKVYLAIALGFCCQGILAQQTSYRWKVEAEAGVSYSVLDTDVSGLSETYYKVRPGFTAAIGAEYNYRRSAGGRDGHPLRSARLPVSEPRR